MEDFKPARLDERPQASGFQAEWLESQKPKTNNNTDACLSFSVTVKDNQAPVKEKTEAPEKNTAERLDKELQDFAKSKLEDPSRDMTKFQKAVGKFCDSTDKEAAIDDLGDTWSKINSLNDVKAEALFKESKAEAANAPGRKELVAEYKHKQDQLFDKINSLPLEESMRITDLIMPQLGETKAQQDERIRKGLANNKPILAAYDEMRKSESNIEADKSPRERQLDKLANQLNSESQTMTEQMEKAYLRSTLKN